MASQKSSIFSAVKDTLSGTFGGIAQVLAGHPLDTVRVRLINQPKPKIGEKPMFTGTLDCIKKTWKLEGIRGLYKGASSPIAGAMAHNASVFFLWGRSREIIKNFKKNKTEKLNGKELFQAGLITGFTISIVESPVDLLKCKLQAQVGKGEYNGVFDALKKISKTHGVRGLYQGLGATALRNTPCFASYFTAFELSTRALSKENEIPSLTTCFISGGIAGGAFWGLFYPFEAIKTRMQADHMDKSKRQFSSILDCFKKTLKDGGIKGFYKGYTAALLRAIPVNATIFWAVTLAKRLINEGSV